MNSLKNLLIIAFLGAAGYGIYVSLARNNADTGQPPGVTEGWPAVPKVELPRRKDVIAAGRLAGDNAAIGCSWCSVGIVGAGQWSAAVGRKFRSARRRPRLRSRRNGFAVGAAVGPRPNRQSAGRNRGCDARNAVSFFAPFCESFLDVRAEPGGDFGHADAAGGRVGHDAGQSGRVVGHCGHAAGEPNATTQPGAWPQFAARSGSGPRRGATAPGKPRRRSPAEQVFRADGRGAKETRRGETG